MPRNQDHTTTEAVLERLEAKRRHWESRADVLAAEANDGRRSDAKRRTLLRDCREARIRAEAYREAHESLTALRKELAASEAVEPLTPAEFNEMDEESFPRHVRTSLTMRGLASIIPPDTPEEKAHRARYHAAVKREADSIWREACERYQTDDPPWTLVAALLDERLAAEV